MGLLNKIKDISTKKPLPKDASISNELSVKSYCGNCGVHYDSSYGSCPFCHDDEEIQRNMWSHWH